MPCARLEGGRREQLVQARVEARVLQAVARDEREDAVQRQHACRGDPSSLSIAADQSRACTHTSADLARRRHTKEHTARRAGAPYHDSLL